MSTTDKEGDVHELFGAQYPQAADVGVLPVHVVREDDDLKNIGVNSFTGVDDLV